MFKICLLSIERKKFIIFQKDKIVSENANSTKKYKKIYIFIIYICFIVVKVIKNIKDLYMAASTNIQKL